MINVQRKFAIIPCKLCSGKWIWLRNVNKVYISRIMSLEKQNGNFGMGVYVKNYYFTDEEFCYQQLRHDNFENLEKAMIKTLAKMKKR